MFDRMLKLLAVLFALSAWSLPALAATLYGTIGAGGGASTLVELDPTTGAQIRTIGSVGYAVNGMTYDRTTSTMYATTSNYDASFPNGLITVNLSTGAGTPVGSGAGQYVNVPTANSSGQLYGWTESGDDPVLWNKAAGTVTVVGESGIGTAVGGMSFDTSDVLYYLNSGANLYTINTTTGAATMVGAVTGVATGTAHHAAIDPDTNRIYAIDRTSNGNNPRNIYVIDIATLAVVQTLPTADDLHVLAFAEPSAPAAAATPIPTLSEWGMIILASLLALGTILTLRRTRQ